MPAATLPELEAACQGASSDFILSQLRAGADVPTALQAFNAQLRTQLSQQQTQRQTTTSTTSTLGVKPVITPLSSDTESNAAVEDFMQLVDDFRSRNPKVERSAAVDAVAMRNPQAHLNYLVACQKGAKAKRLVAEKFS